jgi:hypothetical protein
MEEEEFASDIGDFDVVVKIVESEKRKRAFGSVDKSGIGAPSSESQVINKRSDTYHHRNSHTSDDPRESASLHPRSAYGHPLVHSFPSYRQHNFLRSLPDYIVIAEDDSDEYLLALSALYAYLRILRNVLIVQCKVCWFIKRFCCYSVLGFHS